MTINTSLTSVAPALTGITFERLRSFCDVIAAGSMVAAADGDPVKQSHYSRQIKELESATGVKLFAKAGRYLRPTDAGRQLAALTNLYFSGLKDLQSALTRNRPLIRTAAGEAVLRWLVFPQLSEVLMAAEQHAIEFVTASTAEVIEGVRTGKYELGIVREDAAEEPLATIGSGALDYAFVVPRALLPSRSAAGIEHVKVLPVATLTGGGQFVRSSLDLLKRNGVEPDVRLRMQSLSMIIEAMHSVDVAAFVPEPATPDFPKDQFTVVELEGISRLGRRLNVVYEPSAPTLRPSVRLVGNRLAQICRAREKRGDQIF